MRKVILRTLGAFVLAVVTQGLQVIPASAGRIPIPCTGEALVKVLDIPVLQALQAQGTAGDQVTALGYKFIGCFGGEWVGYTGSSSTYAALDETKLKMLMAMAGRTELPPAPSFMATPSASWVVWLYLVLFSFFCVAKWINRTKKHAEGFAGAASPGEAATSANDAPAPLPREFKAAQAAIDRRIAERRAETANTNEPDVGERRETERRDVPTARQARALAAEARAPRFAAVGAGPSRGAPRAFGKRAVAG